VLDFALCSAKFLSFLLMVIVLEVVLLMPPN